MKNEIDFSNMPCIYWSDTTKISYLQRRIIIYSIMYYEQNESCVSDQYFDGIAYQLVALQKSASKDDWKDSTYYYAMYDFDGTTGYNILSRLNKRDKEYLTNIAFNIIQRWRREQWQKEQNN